MPIKIKIIQNNNTSFKRTIEKILNKINPCYLITTFHLHKEIAISKSLRDTTWIVIVSGGTLWLWLVRGSCGCGFCGAPFKVDRTPPLHHYLLPTVSAIVVTGHPFCFILSLYKYPKNNLPVG